MRLGRGRKISKYKAIRFYDERESWSVEWMCRKLEVSRAGYYKWLKHKTSEEEAENEAIAQLIREYDELYKHTLGYRRMTGYINRLNQKEYGEKRIYGLMRKLGIHSIIRPKKKKYQKSTPEVIADNILKRNFNAERPNEKWATDVTEFKWYEGPIVHKLYLSAVIDLYDLSVVGHAISRCNNNSLVFTTFDRAIAANPEAKPLLHSDRGFQYTSKVFQCKLSEQGMTQSMSRVGHCIDNGPTEGFWGIVKAEMYNLKKFSSEEELRTAIEEFIRYYNEGRYRARFGFKSPLEVRIAALASTKPEQYPIPENPRIQKYKARYAV